MEFQVINRNRNAVIPEGLFKLCGMEDAKLRQYRTEKMRNKGKCGKI